MASRKRAGLLWSGLVSAAAVAFALQLQQVDAQILERPASTQPTPPRAPARPGVSIVPAAPNEESEPFYDGRWGAEVQRAPGAGGAAQLRSGVFDEELGPRPLNAQEVENFEDDTFGEARARPRRLAVPQDGDPVSVFEPLQEEDGEFGEPNALDEEEDPTLADIRSPYDIAAFGGATPAFDPLLLQAEQINPVFSDRSIDHFGADPFAPVGVRLGSFILFTSVESDVDYNSNLFASPDAIGDTALEVRPAARLASNWAVHAVEVRASGDFSFHDRFPSEDDRAYLVEGLGRLDVTRRTDVQAAISREVAQESRNAINANSFGTRPNVTVDRGRAAFNHRFNRLSVQLRGGIVDTRYGDDVIGPIIQSNADRDFTLYEEAVRPKWEFTPTFLIFADVALNQRLYNIPAFSDGIIRSSKGERYRLGVSFGNTGEYLRGEVSLGYGRQTPDNHELQVIDGLLVDANLTWRFSQLTSLLLTASTDVAETTTFDSGGVMQRQYGAELRHNFSARLIGSAGLSLFTRDYVGAGLHEEQFSAATGLEYYMNRNVVLFGRYEHTEFYTSSPDGNWNGEEVQVGVRLRQ